jgi:hypothetical protein
MGDGAANVLLCWVILMALVTEIERLMDAYRTWLKDKTAVRDVNGTWVEITTPYLDRNNDARQIYARQSNGGFLLSERIWCEAER